MNKYIQIFYYGIAARIKKYLKDNGMKQAKFCSDTGIDAAAFSRILNMRIIPGKNKYLLSVGYMEVIAKKMGISPYQLIWGDDKEQEEFVKIIILSIIMNGTKLNPFVYYDDPLELFQWAVKQKSIPEDLRLYALTAISLLENYPDKADTHRVCKTSFEGENDAGKPLSIYELELAIRFHFSKCYVFFYNQKNLKLYELLDVEYDEKLERLSNIILNQIMYDYEFATKCIMRITNYMNNQSTIKHVDLYEQLKYFLLYRGVYGDIALDFKEKEYHLFIKAFNKYWDRQGKHYINFFKEKVFDNKELEKSGLKNFQDNYFNEIIKSDEFLYISENPIIDEYVEEEAVLSKNYIRHFLQYMIQRGRTIYGGHEPDCMDYVSDLIETTRNYSEKVLTNYTNLEVIQRMKEKGYSDEQLRKMKIL